jgi:hypothetical protein
VSEANEQTFVETGVENMEKQIGPSFHPLFITTWRILALQENNCDCTTHGR